MLISGAMFYYVITHKAMIQDQPPQHAECAFHAVGLRCEKLRFGVTLSLSALGPVVFHGLVTGVLYSGF